MKVLNFEFKARTNQLEESENKLKNLNPQFIGEDHQVDTYFHVPKGRLKLREGNIENALIYYERPDIADAKQSDVLLYKHSSDPALKTILVQAYGIRSIVDKKRRIYFIDNVKFHFDKVEGLGTFIEVEAIDWKGEIGLEKLKEQCAYYGELLGVEEGDYVSGSYGEMVALG